MRNLSCTALLLTIALLSGGVAANRPAAAEDATRDEGFVDLFNGKDLTGWQTAGKWIVQDDGLLKLVPSPRGLGLFRHRNFLWTEKQFDNFILDLEYRIEEQGNSGVFCRASNSRSYLQVQICDSNGKQSGLADSDVGGLVGIAAPSKNAAKPVGEWNRLVVTCRDEHVAVRLNGEQVVRVNLAEAHSGKPPLTGNIGLEDYGRPIWFRSIRIKPLD